MGGRSISFQGYVGGVLLDRNLGADTRQAHRRAVVLDMCSRARGRSRSFLPRSSSCCAVIGSSDLGQLVEILAIGRISAVMANSV